MAIVFSDGFESNDFSNWGAVDFGGTFFTVQGTTVDVGTKAAQAVQSGGGTFAFADSGAKFSLTQVWTGIRFRFSALPSDITLFLVACGTPTAINTTTLSLTTGGKIEVRNNSVGTQDVLGTSTTTLSANTFYTVEARTLVSGTIGEVDMRLNGNIEVSVTGINNGAASPVTSVQLDNITDGGGGSGSTFFFDQVKVDDAAFPFTFGTPWFETAGGLFVPAQAKAIGGSPT